MRLAYVVLSVAFLSACASAPSSPTVPAPASSPAPVAAPTPAPTPTAAAPATPAAHAAATTSSQPKAPRGYKLQQREGQVYYCKMTKVLGSNIERSVCITPKEYEEMNARTERDRQDMRQKATMCNGATGVCGG